MADHVAGMERVVEAIGTDALFVLEEFTLLGPFFQRRFLFAGFRGRGRRSAAAAFRLFQALGARAGLRLHPPILMLGAAGSAFHFLDRPLKLIEDHVGQGQFTAETIGINQLANGRHFDSLGKIFIGRFTPPPWRFNAA